LTHANAIGITLNFLSPERDADESGDAFIFDESHTPTSFSEAFITFPSNASLLT